MCINSVLANLSHPSASLRKEGFGSQFADTQSVVLGKAWRQEHEVAVTSHLQAGVKEMNAAAWLFLLFF